MLDDAPRLPPSEAGWSSSPEAETQLLSLAEFRTALKRSFWTIAACLLMAVALATFYVVSTPASYIASAQLMIEPAKQRFPWQDSNVVDLTVDNAQVESQVQVLRSERIATDVIAALGLANDPEFRSNSAKSEYEQHRIALARFIDALSTSRIGQSYVIGISFRSTDPEKAARITNAINAAYIRDLLRAKTEDARQAGEWMQDRVSELGVQLNTAAAAVQKFRASNGIVDNGNNSQARLLDKLTELEARAQAYRKLYESFVQRLTENQQQESYPVSNARVITAASTPLVKSYPKTKLVVLLSILLGLLGGGGIAAARSIIDGTVCSVKQMRQALGLDCLASLPRFRPTFRNGPTAGYQQVLDAPSSPFTEAIRGIKISLQSTCGGRAGLRVGLISLLPGEGKSTVAVSLASLFAASGSKTLLIDADFREPSLSRRLTPGAKRGLIDALKAEPESAIVFDPKTTVHILPLVDSERLHGSADLLGSPAMQHLLGQLEGAFATVIIDLPSLTTAVDARAIGPLLDGCILVVEWGRTPLEPLKEAVALLRAGRIRVLGAVINKFEEGIPPLFGLRLDSLRVLGQSGYRGRLIQVGSR